MPHSSSSSSSSSSLLASTSHQGEEKDKDKEEEEEEEEEEEWGICKSLPSPRGNASRLNFEWRDRLHLGWGYV